MIHKSGFETKIMNCGEWNVIGDYFEQARCNAAKKNVAKQLQIQNSIFRSIKNFNLRYIKGEMGLSYFELEPLQHCGKKLLPQGSNWQKQLQDKEQEHLGRCEFRTAKVLLFCNFFA